MARGAAAKLASLSEYLQRHAASAPRSEATVGDGERLTYAQLDSVVDALCLELNRQGLRAGHRLAFLGSPGPAFWAVLLASSRMKVVWLGMNPAYSPRELAHVLRDATPALICVDANVSSESRTALQQAEKLAAASAPVIELQRGARGSLASLQCSSAAISDGGEPRSIPEDAAIIVYTSGTTGEPKGAIITARGLVENGWWMARRCGFEPGRTLADLPINHIGCIGDICATSLVMGSTLVFEPRFDAANAVNCLRRERITWLGLVPAQYQLMVTHGLGTADLATVRQLAWGGAPMPRVLVERLAGTVPDLFNSYGLTECSGTIAFTCRGASIDQLTETVGYPVDADRVRIADAAAGVGEIQIRGPHMFAGYFGREDASRVAFTSDGWLRTGDVGQLDADGLRLVGRTKEMFKSGGYNIYPREIERVIELLPGVELCAVIGARDPLWGETGVAFVQADPARISASLLDAHCRDHLARFKVPKRFVIREALPLLPIGKIDKRALAPLMDTTLAAL